MPSPAATRAWALVDKDRMIEDEGGMLSVWENADIADIACDPGWQSVVEVVIVARAEWERMKSEVGCDVR